MLRNINSADRTTFDVIVVGAGIYGACVAWDASMRGLKVALVDQGDFGSATSANSQKIIHGGLRYLQHADLKRMRESIRERSTLMRIAPHLVRPCPFLVPTFGWRGKLTFSLALKLNDLISFDRNRGLSPEHYLGAGRLISKTQWLRRFPGLDHPALSGAALFYDGQVTNPNRLILSILRSAAKAGAQLANYVKVTRFLREHGTVTGVQAHDILSDKSFDLQANMVVNCAGPWIDQVLSLPGASAETGTKFFKAFVLVTRRLFEDYAVGVPGRRRYKDAAGIVDKGHRFFFITPWRHTSLIGTFYAPHDGRPDDFEITHEDLDDAIHQVNELLPDAHLTTDDVYFIHAGLLPRGAAEGTAGDIQYARRYKIHDHQREHGIGGLISVMGVKLTTARDVAEKTVDLLQKKLGVAPVAGRTHITPIHGGAIERIDETASRIMAEAGEWIDEETAQHLAETYGSEYAEILQYCRNQPEWRGRVTDGSPVVKAEILHGIRVEMAQRLADVVFRRTELGTTGNPRDDCLSTIATIMADQLNWNQARIRSEIEDVQSVYARLEGMKCLKSNNYGPALLDCAAIKE